MDDLDQFDAFERLALAGVMGRAAKEYAAYQSIPTRIPSASSVLLEIEAIAADRWFAQQWGEAPIYEVSGLPLPVDYDANGTIRLFNPTHYRRIIEQYLIQHVAQRTSKLDEVRYDAYFARAYPMTLCLEVRVQSSLMGKVNADNVMVILVEQISIALCKFLSINRAHIVAPKIAWSYHHNHCGIDVAIIPWDDDAEVVA